MSDGPGNGTELAYLRGKVNELEREAGEQRADLRALTDRVAARLELITKTILATERTANAVLIAVEQLVGHRIDPDQPAEVSKIAAQMRRKKGKRP